MFNLLKDSRQILSILDSVSELDLNYLDGKYTSVLKRLDRNVKKWRAFKVFRVASFFKFALQNYSIRKMGNGEVDFLLFSGSLNQSKMLRPICEKIQRQNTTVFISNEKNKNDIKIKFSFYQIFLAAWILFCRRKSLKKLVDKTNAKNLHKLKLERYYFSYLYIVFFYAFFEKNKAKMILLSNDHNLPNRCLILIASFYKIKTAFFPHGAGSKLLPPLSFNFSFLDGEASASNYFKIEQSKELMIKPESRCIILKGNLNNIAVKKQKPKINTIGVALSELDSLMGLKKILNICNRNNISVIIRVHPQYPLHLMKALELLIEKSPHKIQDSRFENENDFFQKILLLIAGNTSLHILAAISNTASFYYDFETNNYNQDLYGHVEHQLVKELPNDFFIGGIEAIDYLSNFNIPDDKIRYFSDSYATVAQGKELDLVVAELGNIVNGGELKKYQNDCNLETRFSGFKVYRCERA